MKTLVNILQQRASSTSRGITFIEGTDAGEYISYGELYDMALQRLTGLRELGIGAGHELVFQVQDNKTFLILFWACILGGIIPVPIAIGQNEDHRQKVFNVWNVLNRPWLATAGAQWIKIREFANEKGLGAALLQMERSIVDVEKIGHFEKGELFDVQETDIAFIQFSSGSTGNPKGVVLTHKNLIANIDAIAVAAGYTADDSTLSWMPLTHDMGIIGFHLNPLYSGMHQSIISTEAFIRRPSLWLEKATQHRATILASPNFGYKYVLKHLRPPDGAPLNLSSVRILYNGAEPISIALCETFIEKMQAFQLRRTAMCPVYGLAEASLAVSMSGLQDEVKYALLDRNHLKEGDRAVFTADRNGVRFANVGRVINGCAIRIADHAGMPLADGTIGEVHIKGDNVTQGYYNNEEATAKILFGNGWLNTGDLGFVQEGCLFITGRCKDILFLNGQNYYPHDLEEIATAVDGIELNKVVIAGLFKEDIQREESMAFVLYRGSLESFVPLATTLKELVSIKTGLVLDGILPVKDIPRTTSGKLQRYKLIDAYRNGEWQEIEEKLKTLMRDDRVEQAQAMFNPVDQAGKSLLESWQTVFHLTTIAGTAHFFELGGNSLKAAEISMLLYKHTGLELKLETIYRHPTLQDLASTLSSTGTTSFMPIPPAGNTGPATPAQKRLYYLWELDRQATTYNISTVFRLQGKPDAERWKHCFQELADRHDVLRMSFSLADAPIFVVHDKAGIEMKHMLCAAEDADVVLKELIHPFDLHAPGLLRAAIVETGTDHYYLFIDVHHIVSDGRSIYELTKELAALYHHKPLRPLKIGYKDFAVWENARLSDQSAQTASYWLDQFVDDFQVLELPTDLPRPAVFDSAGRKLPFHLSRELSDRLKTLAARLGCTLHTLLFAAYRVLLYKYTGQDDIVIGIPADGRTHPDVQGVHGMFVNSLCMRGKLEPQESFRQLLEKERIRIARALDCLEYPFELLLNALQLKRDVSRNPIFDTMFVYQNIGVQEGEDNWLEPYFIDPGTSKFDLSIEIMDSGDLLDYRVEYSTQLFRDETILNFGRRFEFLLTLLADDPDIVIDRLSLVSPGEKAELQAFNRTAADLPLEKTIYQLFEEQAKRSPGRLAILDGEKRLSYAALTAGVDKLAGLLRYKELQPGDVVAICLDRSAGFVLAVLAVWKTGGAYLPIDPDLPPERMRYILDYSRAAGFIGNARTIAALDHRDRVVVDIDSEWEGASGPDTAVFNELAYIIYTSGTTGNPKGVKIDQRSLTNYICSAAHYYVRGAAVNFALHTSISFDLTVTAIFTPLITGNTIVVYADNNNNDLLIERILLDDQADVIKLTPSHLKLIKRMNGLPKENSRKKRFIVGGEKLEASLAADIVGLFRGNVEIYNEYGPTEATVGCMIHRYTVTDPGPGVPIGKPFFNTRCYVLDRHLNPVPKGISGELFIAGAGLSAGYLNNPALTAERFIADPFYPGELMYKTGDLVKILPAGIIDYIGRNDSQIKLNGYRIEPLEIQEHLNRVQGITGSLVILKENEKGHRVLTAYYTCEPGYPVPDDFEIRDLLSQQLPHYMMPVYFQRVGNIPLTLNGKVDIDALPAPGEHIPTTASLSALEEILEETILEVWRKVLNEPELTVEDNFFEFGGDSIKAVQISARLMEKGIDVNVKDILVFRNVRQTGRRARPMRENNYQQGPVSGVRPLLPIESWFFDQGFARPEYYNQSVLLTLHQEVKLTFLQRVFDLLISHHDGLRVNLDPERAALFYNQAWIDSRISIGEITCDHIGQATDLFETLKGQFDLSRSLLLKPVLISTQQGRYLFITAHHLIMDGVSWRILLQDLYRSYKALAEGTEDIETVLPPKTASSLDWESYLTRQAEKLRTDPKEGYWERIEAMTFQIPRDLETADRTVAGACHLIGVFDKEQTGYLIRDANKVYKTDTLMLLTVAMATAVRDWSGQDELIVEFENHGRHLDHPNVSRTTGWFTVMYPVYLNPGRGGIGEQIMTIKEQIMRVPNNGMGYALARPRNNRQSELRFNYLGVFGAELDNDLFSLSPLSTGRESAPANELTTNLEWNLMIVDGELRLDILYHSKMYRESTIRRLQENFFTKLTQLLTHIANERELYFTPSDFEGLTIDQQELNDLFL